MRIIKFQAENIKRLIAVEIEPSGDVIKITGKNGAGKTSVLDAIWWALAGADNIQSEPVRKGAKSAKVELIISPDDDGETLVVSRTFTQKGSYLKVSKGKGFKAGRPQEMLDALIGSLTFDPLAFMRKDQASQASILRSISGIDTSELDASRSAVYDERRDAGRDLRQAEAELSAAPEVACQGGEKDQASLVERLSAAQKNVLERSSIEGRIGQLKAAAEQADAQMTAVVAALANAKKEIEAEEAALREMVEPEDTGALTEELRGVESHNAAVRQRKAREKIAERVDSLRSDADRFGKELSRIDEEKEAMIANAAMPLDGLSFQDGVVAFRGIPLDQASQAEQLRVSMAIAMAGNPKLRVIRITDGSLLDSDSMAIIEELAADRDFQVWIEMVDESGEVGVFIEDGVVAAAGDSVS